MMNNQTDDIPSIRYFNIYINLFYLICGNIGNLFKIAFFLQKPLRSIPCSVYILCSTFSDFITLNNLPLLQLLTYRHPEYHWIRVAVDWSNHQNQTTMLSYSVSTYDIIMCKARSYFHMLSTDISLQMLLFASINRYCSIQRRKKRQANSCWFVRHFCDHPNIYRLCVISTLITVLLSFNHIFNFTINSPSEGCVPRSRFLWVVWISFIHCLLLPILMILFGTLTLKNMQYLSVFSRHLHRFQCHYQRKYQPKKQRYLEACLNCSRCQNSMKYQIDRQLTSMIITETLVTIATSIPYGTYAFYNLLRTIQRKTMVDPNESLWIPLLIRTTIYFEPSCGFYIYLMTLTALRKRFFKMIIRSVLPIQNFFWCHR